MRDGRWEVTHLASRIPQRFAPPGSIPVPKARARSTTFGASRPRGPWCCGSFSPAPSRSMIFATSLARSGSSGCGKPCHPGPGSARPGRRRRECGVRHWSRGTTRFAFSPSTPETRRGRSPPAPAASRQERSAGSSAPWDAARDGSSAPPGAWAAKHGSASGRQCSPSTPCRVARWPRSSAAPRSQERPRSP